MLILKLVYFKQSCELNKKCTWYFQEIENVYYSYIKRRVFSNATKSF